MKAGNGFKECIGSIKRSLIYAMSKGSHELFHTNIWAWLIERDNSFVNDFFNGINGDFLRVERETGHRDLTIWLKAHGKENAYVVENKFKALPRESQLDDYARDLRVKNKFGEGLLISLATPFGAEKWKWKTLTQEELMNRIKKRIENSERFDDLEKRMVLAYVEMTQKLSDVLLYYSDSFGQNWPTSVSGQELEDVKLWDIFAKMKSTEFAQYVEYQLETMNEWRQIARDHGLSLAIRPGFSNKSALLDVRFEKQRQDEKGQDEEQFCIGVQIQGNQYRRCVCSHDIKRFKNAEALYRQFCKDGTWLGDNEFLEKNTTMKKEFCKYESKDYRFAYQYVILEDRSFEAIFDRLKTDMSRVGELLKSSEMKSMVDE